MQRKAAAIVRAATPNELGWVERFYHANGYQPVIQLTDRLLLALQDGELCGALRLCEECGSLLLRGMRVAVPLQRQGIGTRLLRAAEELIGERACFCIAHRHLEFFYGQAGFRRIDARQAPQFLSDRCARYRREVEVDVVILRRPARALPGTRRG